MGMGNVETPLRAFVKVTFPVQKAEKGDEDLTCIHCRRGDCEYVILIKGGGCHTWLGICKSCITPYGVEGSI